VNLKRLMPVENCGSQMHVKRDACMCGKSLRPRKKADKAKTN